MRRWISWTPEAMPARHTCRNVQRLCWNRLRPIAVPARLMRHNCSARNATSLEGTDAEKLEDLAEALRNGTARWVPLPARMWYEE
jgi:hypothetical protein